MALDLEACTGGRTRHFSLRHTEVDLFDAAAFCADEVMVMTAIANTVAPCAVSQLDPVQHTQLNQHVYRPKQRGPSQLRVFSLELLPQLVGGEVGPGSGTGGQALRDQTSWTRGAKTSRVEGGENRVLGDRHAWRCLHALW